MANMNPNANLDLAQIGQLTEDQARDLIEAIRWPNGPRCVHCASDQVYKLKGKSTRAGLYKCRECKGQFTVRVGTIFEDSHIPLHKWLMALHLMTSSKKGISSKQLQRNLGLASYQSAWHMSHRIRHAMFAPDGLLLTGSVEVDETYVGGKPRPGSDEKAKRGRGTKKIPVVALVERDGRVRSRVIEHVDAKTLKSAIRENVDRSATIYTDEWSSYRGIGSEFAGGHKTVNHGAGEYVSGDASTNTVESFFALMKRGVYGVFHHVSKQHLQRYCDEFSFRWDRRAMTDGERTIDAIRGAEGKRLTYD
jgi:transposase-like protein